MNKCECKSERKKIRSKEEYDKLIHRLNRIEGQVRGVRKMVENNTYCTDILIQSSAIASAINAFNRELLNAHIHSCVVNDIKNGKIEAIDELSKLVLKLMK